MVFKRIKMYGDMVMFRHTLFALPFALIGVILAADGLPSIRELWWVFVAMIGARNGANAFNRWADREIDAVNPRTALRHLPRKLLLEWEVLGLSILGFGLFVLAAYMLNPLCFLLLPVPLFIMIVYSYSKRFTYLCHLILGVAVGGAPMGGWLAIRGTISFPDIIYPLLLWVSVALWVAGFDIIYGTQDTAFDKSYGIHSIPAAFGIKKALDIACYFHVLTVLFLGITGLMMNLGWMYAFGVCITAFLLFYGHSVISPENLGMVKVACYNVNEIIGPVMFIFTLLDVIL